MIKVEIVEENKLLSNWNESLGFVHIGTEKYDFFPFTCGYMEKELGASNAMEGRIYQNRHIIWTIMLDIIEGSYKD